ncbi:MAG: hypothetical protein KF727_06445 [Microbacteriaceae bacterium]|nr:hypothetical protein [Microbacteriaceae bacterium]
MLVGNTDLPNVMLLLAGLVLVVAGAAAIRFREEISDYLRDLRDQFFGSPLGRDRKKQPGPPIVPIVAGVILIALGVVGAYGGLFAELPPPGAPRV